MFHRTWAGDRPLSGEFKPRETQTQSQLTCILSPHFRPNRTMIEAVAFTMMSFRESSLPTHSEENPRDGEGD